MNVTVRHLVVDHRIADVIVTDDTGERHRVGHHPADGWWCITHGTARCPAVAAARDAVVDLEDHDA